MIKNVDKLKDNNNELQKDNDSINTNLKRESKEKKIKLKKDEEKIKILKNTEQQKADTNQTVKEKEENIQIEFEEEISLLREEKLRLLAEMENLRKRSDREKIDSIKYGSVNFARDMLAIGDNLSRALENLPDDDGESKSIVNLIDGLKMVQKEFFLILKKNGVKKIDAINNKFDHNYHQAIVEIETNDHEEGMVVKEIQTGYIMHERLLRPTMVGVSKKITAHKKEDQKN